MPGCGSFVYTCLTTDGAAINSAIFSFVPASRKLLVYTTDYSAVGKYYMIVTGTLLGTVSSSITVNVTISSGCELTDFKTSTI